LAAIVRRQSQWFDGRVNVCFQGQFGSDRRRPKATRLTPSRHKLKRGTFSATFFLACIAALELEGVALEEI
jgi:hypothetical protein